MDLFPNSRINTKASYDMHILDTYLIIQLRILFESSVVIFCGLIIWNYVYIGIILVVIVCICVYTSYILRVFLRSTPSLLRFLANDKALVREIYSETLKNAPYFRTNKKMDLITDRYIKAIDSLQQSSSHINSYAKRWIGTRIAIGHFFLVLAVYLLPLLSIYFVKGFRLTKIEYGLAISWSLRVINNFEFFLSSFLNCYLSIPAFGRISYFI